MFTIDVGELYGNTDYSDLTLKFGTRTFYAHKIIVCKRLKYFEKLCGPKSWGVESTQCVIELKGDENEGKTALTSHLPFLLRC
jgi:hypothetical protein